MSHSFTNFIFSVDSHDETNFTELMNFHNLPENGIL